MMKHRPNEVKLYYNFDCLVRVLCRILQLARDLQKFCTLLFIKATKIQIFSYSNSRIICDSNTCYRTMVLSDAVFKNDIYQHPGSKRKL